MESLGAAAPLLFGFGFLIGGILLFVPETTAPIAEYFGDFFAGIFFPNARFAKPPLSYIVARSYSKQARYAEAFQEYQKIISYYPRERTAYIEVIALLQVSGEKKMAMKYRRLLKKRFRRKS
jgi:two-component SAPR family response regulator